MRVLFVSQEIPPDTAWGGIATHVDVLGQALVKKGHEVHVLSVVPGQPASQATRGGMTIHRFAVPPRTDPSGRLPETWPRVLLANSVARLVGKLGVRPDVIECPDWMAEGLFLGLRGGFPLVIRLHAGARQVFPHSGQGRGCRGLDGRLATWLEETSTRRGHVIVSSRPHLEEVASRLRLDDGSLHPIPVPIRLPAPSRVDSSSPPRITCVGRLEPRKAPEVLLRAAPRVLEAVPEARFVFVGTDSWPGGPSSSAWLSAEAQRLGVSRAVEFTGRLDQVEVYTELERSTVCAFPSRWECSANAAAEAAAAGRPVIATPLPAFRELVRDGTTGWLLSAEDGPGWVRALVTLLRDRSMAQRMGAAGAVHVGAIAEPGRVAELTLAAYEEARDRWQHGLRAGTRRLAGRRASAR